MWLRLFAGALLPVPLGAVIYFFQAMSNFRMSDFIIVMMFGYMFVGIPSIIYSLLMEFIVNPGIKDHILAVILSVGLGLLSGVVSYMIFEESSLIGIGAIVGLAVGALLRNMYIRTEHITRLTSDNK